MTAPPVSAAVRTLPKAVLHDHLDGGLRVGTIIELADDCGHELPAAHPAELRQYFVRGADSRDILKYLDTFQHTVGVLQTAAALERVAAEAVADLAADGVVYAELRYAPELHQQGGLALDAVVEAVDAGFVRGMAEVAEAGRSIAVHTIICAMRTAKRSQEVAEAAVRGRDRGAGIVAFDLAGAETGFPPSDHAAALAVARRGLLRITIHASEPPGLELIADALACGAERVGHGVRLVEGCAAGPDGELVLGPLARSVRERQIALELCPSCNVQIGAVPSIAEHPVVALLRAGIAATVNTDNRLMSDVSVSSELALVADTFGLTMADLAQLTVNAVEAGFGPLDERRRLVREVIVPAYAAAEQRP